MNGLSPGKGRARESMQSWTRGWRLALRTAMLYLVFAGLWVLVSDWLLATLVHDSQALTRLQTVKGLFFVVGTAIFVWAHIRRDLGAQLRSEQAARDNETRLRLALEQAGALLWTTDTHLRLTSCLGAGLFDLGLRPRQAMGQTVQEPPQTAEPEPAIVAAHRRALQGQATSLEHTWAGKAHHVNLQPLRDQAGQIVGVIGIALDISSRYRMEADLRQQQEILEIILDNAPIMTTFRAPDQALRWANRGWQQALGWTLAEAQGQELLQEFYPDPDYRCGVQEFIDQATGAWGEFQMKCRDGTLIDTLWSCVALLDGQHVNIGLDITEAKRAQQAAAALDENLLAIVHASPAAILDLDPEGRVLSIWNPAAEIMFGWNRDEVLGKPILFVPDEGQDRFRSVLDRVLAGESFTGVELQRQRRDGSPIDISLSTTALRDSLGRVRGTMAVILDITEHKRWEKELLDAKSVLEQTFASLAEVVLVIDPSGRKIVMCNAAVEPIFGYRIEELIGQGTLMLHVSRERYEQFGRMIGPDLQDKGWFQTEYEMRHKDGRVIHTEIRVTAIGDNVWQPARTVSVVRDISERVRAEKALKRYAERLEVWREIDRAILAAESPKAIAMATLRHLRQLTGCVRASLAMFDRGRGDAELLAVQTGDSSGLDSGQRVALEWFGDLNLLRQGQLHAVEDVEDPTLALPSAQALKADGVRSYVNIPVMAQEGLIGSLNLGFQQQGAMGPDELQIAREAADQLAVALCQAQLHEQVQRHAQELEQRVAARTRQLSALYQITAVASQSMSLDNVLARSLELLVAAMDCDSGTIYLLEDAHPAPGRGRLRLDAAQGIDSHLRFNPDVLPLDGSLAGWVTRHGEPLVVTDMTADPRTFQIPGLTPHAYLGVPLRVDGQVAGTLDVLRGPEQPLFGTEETALLTSLADQIGQAIQTSWLRDLARRAAVVEERQRLARELHDSVTQSLYSATLLAETGRLASVAGDLKTAGDSLERLGQVSLEALKEMRLLIYELRPTMLGQEGLVSALQHRLDAVEGRAGIEARLLVEGEVLLPLAAQEGLYRICLEALNNALKHAAATAVVVRIETSAERFELRVVDNGRGFDPQAALDGGGLGLITMRERARDMGAEFAVVSAPGQGTSVQVRLSLPTQALP